MTITLNGTTGITTPAQTVQGDLTTTGNTVLGDASTDTLNVANGSLIKDSSGNLGLAVTPSAWGGTYKAMQIGQTAVFGGNASFNRNYCSSNVYWNGTNYKYITSSQATQFEQSDGAYYWLQAASGTAGNNITFTQAMTLDSSGNLLVGNTSNASNYKVLITAGNQPALRCENANTNDLIAVKGNYNGSSSSGMYVMPMRFGDDTYRGGIYWNGSTVAYQTSSDYRLKENVAPMTGALEKVLALKPCTYTWKETGRDGQGFLAHELQEVVPDCVTGEKDEVNEDGSIKAQAIDTSFLVATLTAAIQELKAELDTVKTELATLKGTA